MERANYKETLQEIRRLAAEVIEHMEAEDRAPAPAVHEREWINRDPYAFSNHPGTFSKFTFPGETRLYEEGRILREHTFNGAFAAALTAALQEIWNLDGGVTYASTGFNKFYGAINVRTKKGSSSWSMHAFGLAVDFAAARNPLISATTSFTNVVVDIMESHGFWWGPRAWGMPGFDNVRYPKMYFDPMHFQIPEPYCIPGCWYSEVGHGLYGKRG